MKYDNAKVRANIKSICKIKGLELGQIENSIGKYPGYFSRHRLSAEMLFSVADAIGIDPMELVTSDFTETLTKTEAKEKIRDAMTRLSKYMKQEEMVKMAILMIGDIYHTSV